MASNGREETCCHSPAARVGYKVLIYQGHVDGGQLSGRMPPPHLLPE